MTTLTVTFASESGPSARELKALREVCEYLADIPIADLARRLAAAPDLVIRVGERHDTDTPDPAAVHAMAVLSDAGLRPRAHGLPYGPAWIARELGLDPIRAGEHRWTYLPSFRPELVVTASPRGDRWCVHAAWPSSSLWQDRYHSWRPSIDQARVLRRPGSLRPDSPRPLPDPRRLRVSWAAGEANDHSSRIATHAIEQLRGVTELPRRMDILDGVQIHLELPTADGVRTLTASSPGRDDRLGFALADSGIALAMSLPSPELASLLAGSR